MSLLKEFAKEWLKAVSDLNNVGNLIVPDYEGLCSNFTSYCRQYSIRSMELKYELLRCYGTFDLPFDRSVALSIKDTAKHLNPKRKAFMEAIAQGKLVVDDFGDMVTVNDS